MEIDIYVKKQIRDYKQTNFPIWRAMPISKCWVGKPTAQYVIWWGGRILEYRGSYREAIQRRREIWNAS